MLDFKDPRYAGYSALTVGGVIVLACVLAFNIMNPPKKIVRSTPPETRKALGSLQRSTLSLADDKRAAEKKIANALWNVSLQELGPTALGQVNEAAVKRKVKVSSFRPQKINNVKGVTLVPYVMTVEGSYPDVVGLVRDLGNENSKLAVNLVQLASADANSDKVSATVGLVAYISSPEVGDSGGG